MLPEIPSLFPMLSLWVYLLVYFLFAEIDKMSVSLYLHRHQTHRGIEEMHPILSHFFRAWLFLRNPMITGEWVAVHRKHHNNVETVNDPHSPVIYGVWKVFFLGGFVLYPRAARDKETIRTYGYGTPNDWLERNLYSQWSYVGIIFMLLIDGLLWGWPGVLMWTAKTTVIAVFAQGYINAIAHKWGYRNYNTKDQSTNVIPWGFLGAGEELHNNHHKVPRSAKFSHRTFTIKIGHYHLEIPEIDLGWLYIRAFQKIGLIGKVYVHQET